ncbi:MAG: hypothetical protein ACYCW6_29770 [Candidatus Xenobia bacterium]
MSLEQAVRALQMDMAQLKSTLAETREALGNVERTFDNFTSRFNEVAEMLITHDTEPLKRQAAMEALVYELRDRVEKLEKRGAA